MALILSKSLDLCIVTLFAPVTLMAIFYLCHEASSAAGEQLRKRPRGEGNSYVCVAVVAMVTVVAGIYFHKIWETQCSFRTLQPMPALYCEKPTHNGRDNILNPKSNSDSDQLNPTIWVIRG